ncbi:MULTISPECIES: tripartite tricarboxylate transporter substrate binding protein [Pannonibacter]|uniref:Tricarboxylate transport protein TctC n=1 Tax=Pannonibacter phragmitetus TaxID=121719 RepID=A0A0U3MZM0_9HYPH|nr:MULTISPECIES: tripartite tricarboxylate transporter substrate binding protein [Pannonibacter]ALV29751.1 tricarboxylate transport protein TctC [Pannonibacter phragmitetus]MBA4203573.1 tripartite tricarboxylate transporter substrate binding protein [Polymorphum sp.]SUB00114.1 Tripartite tricarboxylate transporter family receptor [Pannonibacter phragmitetus]
MKKTLIGAALALGLAVVPALAEYPDKEIQGIIQWGAGGSTDTVMRAVTPHAEQALGGKIIMQNVTGGVGALALNMVEAGDADGYTILFGAENPLLYKVMKLGEKDYSDFTPINVLARGIPILVARPDAPFNTFQEMIAYINANPKAVKFGSTGPGGLPSVVTAMINQKTPIDVTFVPYDGDGPALTALQGGAIDVMPAVLGAAVENIKAGTMKPIALFDVEPTPALPDVPTIVSTNPEFAELLPWGPFFGIFVKKGTPDDVVAKLVAAYQEGAKNEDFLKLMDSRGFKMMSYSGAEAEDFLSKWQSTTSWLVWEAGLAKASPEEFGIPKP